MIDEFGQLVTQLLESNYIPVRGKQLTKGEAMAVESAQAWAAALVAVELQPHVDAPVSIHRGNSSATCDCICHRYRSESPIPALEIEFSQSLFVITISIRARQWPDEWNGDSAEVVTRAARRFFRDAGRLDLKINKRLDGVMVGGQDPDKRLPAFTRDWRDSLQWWRDATNLGFVILKRTGSGQAVLPSFDLQSNLVWFEMLGQPRTR